MTRQTNVALPVVALACFLQGSVRADDGVFRDVSPFAVHVSVDGSTRDDELEKTLANSCLKMLRDSKVPTENTASYADEKNPFFHWEFGVRRTQDGTLCCISRLFVKLRTKNPINNTVMDGVLASAFDVRFLGSSETPDKVFGDFMKENAGLVTKMWRQDNSLAATAANDVLNLDFTEGIWNLPLDGFARNQRKDGSFKVIDLGFARNIDTDVVPKRLDLPADASIAELIRKFDSGDLVVLEPDLILPVRGAMVAPLKVKKAPKHLFDQAAMRASLAGMTRSEIVKQIRDYTSARIAEVKSRNNHESDDALALRLIPKRYYGAVRPDGKLALMGAHGKSGDIMLQFVPIGNSKDFSATQ